MPRTWRSHRHPQPGGGTPPPPPRRRYNHGAYVAIGWPGQINQAIGQDTGTFIDPDGNTGHYNLGRIPGGHLGTAVFPGMGALNPAVDGPSSSGVRGFVVPYYWKELETAKGVYNFSGFDADMNTCIALGVQMIAMIITRTFNAAYNPAPGDAAGATDNLRYLNQLPYVNNNNAGGWQMSRWNNGFYVDPNPPNGLTPTTQNVQARFKLLVNQLLTRWGDSNNLEGIATQETSAGMSAQEQADTGYDADLYLAGLKLEADAVRLGHAKPRHFGYANFVPALRGAGGDSYASAYRQYMAASGCSVGGGPDILPDSASLQTHVYPSYEAVYANAFPNNGPTFCAAQDATFSQSVRTMQEIFNWCTGGTLSSPALPGGYTQHLTLDYLFWNWETTNLPYNFNPDARLVIAANPDFHVYNPP